MSRDLTQREAKAVKVLEDAVRAAWICPDGLLAQILASGRTRLLNAMRYTGSAGPGMSRSAVARRAKRMAQESGEVSKARPGPIVEADFDREGT